MLVAKAHADGVRAAVGNHGIVGFDAVEDGGRVLGNFLGRKAEARRNDGIDLKVGSRAADGVVDAILHVGDAFDFADGVADLRPELVEQDGVLGVKLDLDRFGGVGEVVDVVLEDLRELDIELGLSGLDALPHVIHYFPHGAVPAGFQPDGEVAGVGFSDGGKAELQPGAAGGVFDLRNGMEDARRRVPARGWFRSVSFPRA